MSATRVRVYVLFPYRGSFSVKTEDYRGVVYTVAATNVRQAYAVAHNKVRIDPEESDPVGIISICDGGTGTTLWCGCAGHEVIGGTPAYAAGIRAIRIAIDTHNEHCPNRRPSLAERLRRLQQSSAAKATDDSK